VGVGKGGSQRGVQETQDTRRQESKRARYLENNRAICKKASGRDQKVNTTGQLV
jgi:hypothetical protein